MNRHLAALPVVASFAFLLALVRAPVVSAATSEIQPAAAEVEPTEPKPAQLTLAGRPTASANGVTVSLECQAATGSTCRGSAHLTTFERIRRGKIVRLLVNSKPGSRVALVGSRTFTLAEGAKTKLVVPLVKLGRKLLARFHGIPATLTISLLNTTPHTRISAHTTIEAKKR